MPFIKCRFNSIRNILLANYQAVLFSGVSHICNFKFSGSHIEKSKKKREICFNNINPIHPKYYFNLYSI